MWKQCFTCDMKQAEKIAHLLALSLSQQKELEELIKTYLNDVDRARSNPDVMGEIWSIIKEYTKIADPYNEIKHHYNEELLRYRDDIQQLISASEDCFSTALKVAIAGNLIDFSASHTFDLPMLMDMIHNILNHELAKDDNLLLQQALQNSHKVFYIGDNCGEIVLDKLFIETMKILYPNIEFYYGVRGYPIANDVTIIDALQVHMEDVANVISNGDISLGTVLEKCSDEFKMIFQSSDVIISKGMGNYEGLLSCTHPHLYFLFMAKCEMISNPLGIDLMSIVCMKK